MNYAKVIADSISPRGDRLTTLEVCMHRFVLAEFNTHRVFSRNSASSRAIPLKRSIKNLQDDPAVPIIWASEHPGMSGGDEIEMSDYATTVWLNAMNSSISYAQALANVGVHKSLCNRLLEPFMWHTVIVSSTEWENFFMQRCSPLAQPEIRIAAEQMRDSIQDSIPQEVDYNQWHLPYLQDDERDFPLSTRQAISTARCARVSLLNHDKIKSIEDDLKLFDRLKDPGDGPPHASPLEHVATPYINWPHWGNFHGWLQLRHEIFPAPIPEVLADEAHAS